MSYSIGRKINEIRLLKKVSQDEIANNLGISRQRFSRIESGQSDVSYSMLQRIAEYLAVSVSEITAADTEQGWSVLFRQADDLDIARESVEKIEEIIKTFHAHEKLYYRMRENTGENR